MKRDGYISWCADFLIYCARDFFFGKGSCCNVGNVVITACDNDVAVFVKVAVKSHTKA